VAASCVLLADPHHALIEGVRGLLESAFDCVIMVGDEASLLEAAARLTPLVVVADIGMAEGDLKSFVARILARSSQSRMVLLSVHDEPSVALAAFRAGAHAVVLKRSIATDLLAAVDDVLDGRSYVSRGLQR